MGVEHTGNEMDQRERNGCYNPQEKDYPIKERHMRVPPRERNFLALANLIPQ